MTKCPCEECILLAICKRPNNVSSLLDRCSILVDYIRSTEDAKESIRCLKPPYEEVDIYLTVNAKAICAAARKLRNKRRQNEVPM